MILLGLILGYFLGQIFIDTRKFNRERKIRQAEFDMMSDPEYDVEVQRVQLPREARLYNKFGIHYASILGAGYEDDWDKEKRKRDWEKMREDFIYAMGGQEKYDKLCKQLEVEN